MILHKYLDGCYNILSDLELKVSLLSDLNDPFEHLPANNTSWTPEKVASRNAEMLPQLYEAYNKEKEPLGDFEEFSSKVNSLKSEAAAEFNKTDYDSEIKILKNALDKYVRFICFSSPCGVEHSVLIFYKRLIPPGSL